MPFNASQELNKAKTRASLLAVGVVAVSLALEGCRPTIITANPDEFKIDAASSSDSANPQSPAEELFPSSPAGAAWEQASPTNSLLIRARWIPSSSTHVQAQMLEIFSDADCSSVFNSEVLPATDTSDYSLALPEGTFTFRVTAATETAKIAQSECSEPIIVDRASPTLTGLTDDNNPRLSKTWSWDCGESSCQYRFAIDQNPAGTPGGTYEPTFTATQAGGTGTYYLHVQAVDPAGNSSPVVTVSAVLDNEAPSVSGLSSDLTPRMSKNWAWNCDETCTFRYLIDQTSSSEPAGAFSSATSATQALATGTFYLHVQARDTAGNLSPVVTVSAVLDNTAPSAPSGLSLTAPATSPDSSATPTFRVTGVTAGDTVELHANAGCTSLKASGTATGASIDLTSSALVDGSYSFYAKAVDPAGNASDCSNVSASYTMSSGGSLPDNGGSGFVNMSGNALLFHFDEPSAAGDRIFADSSGAGITASCAAATCPTSVAGPFGNFLRFAGGQFLSLGTQLSQAFSSLTLSVWQRNGSGHLFERYAWDYEPGFGLVMQGTTPQFGHWFGGTGYPQYNLPLNAPAIADNAIWHHIVGTMAPTGSGTTQWKIYVDGVLVNSVIDVRTITSTATQSTCIGRRCTEARYFSGDIEELAIWNRALSAAEVQAIFNAQLSLRN